MKIKCQKCEYERSEQYFYKGFTECKDCIKDYLDSQPLEKAFINIKELLEKANYVINEQLLVNIFFGGSEQYRDLKVGSILGEYLKTINTIPQFEKYRYNQKTETKEKSDIDFLNEDIEKIKGNLKKATFNNDPNAHGKWMNSLRDALELKNRLENKSKWQEFSSHYYEGDKAIKGENEYVATWEQKGDEIRNHKVYKIEKEIPTIKIEIDKNYIIDGDTLTIPIKVNGKNSCAIKGKRVDDKWVLENGTTIKCN